MSDSPALAAVTAIAARRPARKRNPFIVRTLRAGPRRDFRVAEPDRIIVDLPEVAFPLDPMSGREVVSARAAGAFIVADKILPFRAIRAGRSRIVIELAVRPRSCARERYARGGREAGNRLAPVDAAKFMEAAAEHTRGAAEKVRGAAPTPVVERRPWRRFGEPLVCDDPGHGGVDVGGRANMAN